MHQGCRRRFGLATVINDTRGDLRSVRKFACNVEVVLRGFAPWARVAEAEVTRDVIGLDTFSPDNFAVD